MGNGFPCSPYIIQEFSVTVREQTNLLDEGEPQGGNRQAPEPPDMPGWAWNRKSGKMNAGNGLRRKREEVYISAPLQAINVLEDWSRKTAHKMPIVFRAAATRATPAGLVICKRLLKWVSAG